VISLLVVPKYFVRIVNIFVRIAIRTLGSPNLVDIPNFGDESDFPERQVILYLGLLECGFWSVMLYQALDNSRQLVQLTGLFFKLYFMPVLCTVVSCFTDMLREVSVHVGESWRWDESVWRKLT
jgi:hypothetical protein